MVFWKHLAGLRRMTLGKAIEELRTNPISTITFRVSVMEPGQINCIVHDRPDLPGPPLMGHGRDDHEAALDAVRRMRSEVKADAETHPRTG